MSKKRPKSPNAEGKRNIAVQNASKKKRKTNLRALKFKNAELKASLDSQVRSLFYTTARTGTASMTSKLEESNVHDITAVLSNL